DYRGICCLPYSGQLALHGCPLKGVHGSEWFIHDKNDLGGQKSCNGLRPCREGGDALGLAPGAK
ncbi:MAG: hypothetical protein WBA14_06550, partial [Pseudolabrys sp.]